MGYRLRPAVVSLPSLSVIGVVTSPDIYQDDASKSSQQISYEMVSSHSPADIYAAYQKIYGKTGTWKGNIGIPGNARFLFYLPDRTSRSRRTIAVFSIREKMSPDDVRWIGSQPIHPKSIIFMSIFIPLASSEAFQRQHYSGAPVVEVPIPVEPNK